MLGYFAPFHPDEVVHSACARSKERIGAISDRGFRQELFGVWTPIHIQYPNRLGHMVGQIPSEFLVTVDRIIDDCTLAPMLRPFLSPKAYIDLRSYMSGSDLRYRLGMISKAHEKTSRMKFCPSCVEGDRNMYGEAYWHRLHQSSLVQVCPTHSCYLLYVDSQIMPNYYLRSAETIIPIGNAIKMTNPMDPYDGLLLWMASQTKWLLEHPNELICVNKLAAAYMKAFHDAELTSRGKPAYGRIIDHVKQLIAPYVDRNEEFASVYHAKSLYSLENAVRYTVGHPGLQFLLMYSLGIDVCRLPNKIMYFHFEPGPWPCLNRVCNRYGKAVIELYEVTDRYDGTQRGLFTCECGYTYSRPTQDFDGKTRYKPDHIVDRGTLWREKLTTMWSDRSMTQEQVAQILGCSRTVAINMARKLELPGRYKEEYREANKPIKVTDVIDRQKMCREMIGDILHRHPETSRASIYKLAPASMQWLRKHDHIWLESVLPDTKRVGNKVDMRVRDRNYARRVSVTKKKLIESQITSMFRISKNCLALAMRIQRAQLARGFYPRTAQAIEEASETSAQYKIRRLLWFVNNMVATNDTSFNEVLYKVGIRTSMRHIPSIAAAIIEAQQIFSHRIMSDSEIELLDYLA